MLASAKVHLAEQKKRKEENQLELRGVSEVTAQRRISLNSFPPRYFDQTIIRKRR